MDTARYFCLLFLIFSSNSISQSKNQLTEILWLQSNTPPFHLDSENTQMGLCDNLTKQLISSIKDVNILDYLFHKNELINISKKAKMSAFHA